MKVKKTIEKIVTGEKLIAIIIPGDFCGKGVEFFTPKEYSQQLGYMKHPKGHEICPHTHKLVIRKIKYTQETLLVRSGRVRVDFFSSAKQYLKSRELTAGDVVLLAGGGHGFRFLEDSEMIEIKQGPYSSLAVDKKRFARVDE